jgi:hypothetical protein
MIPSWESAPQKRPDRAYKAVRGRSFAKIRQDSAAMAHRGEGMQKRLNIRRPLSRAVLGLAVAALLTSATVSAARAGDDDEDESFMAKFMSAIGLKRGIDYNPINYGERSPLVVPPSRDLPPPIAAAAPSNPEWPKDPDVRRRKLAKSKQHKVSNSTYELSEDTRPLRPDELEVGRKRGMDEGKPGIDSQAAQNPSSQSQLGNRNGFFSFNWFKKEEYGTFTGEPARAELTDPPPGYRTPSADQPYGIGPDKTPVKNKNIGERMEADTGH